MVHLNELKAGMINWTVRGSVRKKSQVSEYKLGKWFDFILFDEVCAIRTVVFNDGFNKFFDLIHNDHSYEIKNGIVKYNKYNPNTAEITLTPNSEIVEIDDLDIMVSKNDNYIKLIDIPNTTSETVSVMGVIKTMEEAKKITVRTKEKIIRNITIQDEQATVQLTLWSYHDMKFNINDVIAIEDGVLNKYRGGIIINVYSSSEITINPNWKRTTDLQNWNEANESVEILDISQFISQPDEDINVSNAQCLEQAQNELKKLLEKEEFIKIKKQRLIQEIQKRS